MSLAIMEEEIINMELIEKPSRIFTCKRCGCKLKITKADDIHYDKVKVKNGKTIYGHYMQCPICANKVIVDIDKN